MTLNLPPEPASPPLPAELPPEPADEPAVPADEPPEPALEPPLPAELPPVPAVPAAPPLPPLTMVLLVVDSASQPARAKEARLKIKENPRAFRMAPSSPNLLGCQTPCDQSFFKFL